MFHRAVVPILTFGLIATVVGCGTDSPTATNGAPAGAGSTAGEPGAAEYGAGAGSASGKQEAGVVKVQGYRFVPEQVEVQAGQTVTWRFVDADGHDVTANDRSFASEVLAGGQQFQHRFDKPGSYSYVCTLHPGMIGKVVVR